MWTHHPQIQIKAHVLEEKERKMMALKHRLTRVHSELCLAYSAGSATFLKKDPPLFRYSKTVIPSNTGCLIVAVRNVMTVEINSQLFDEGTIVEYVDRFFVASAATRNYLPKLLVTKVVYAFACTVVKWF